MDEIGMLDRERLLVFGTGQFYARRREALYSLWREEDVVAFVDNRAREIGSFEGRPVLLPEAVGSVPYDRILLMAADAEGMRAQLLCLGVSAERIAAWAELVYHSVAGGWKWGLPAVKPGQHRLLLVTDAFAYNGGSIAAFHAAAVLQDRGYDVTVAGMPGDHAFAEEMWQRGFSLVVCPRLHRGFERFRDWLLSFDVLFCNTLFTFPLTLAMEGALPVVCWIHEPSICYDMFFRKEASFRDGGRAGAGPLPFSGKIYAVSTIAQDNFEREMPYAADGLLPYGIPDEYDGDEGEREEVLTFSLIGLVEARKGQDVFLEAVRRLPEAVRRRCRFELIGRLGDGDFAQRVRETASCRTEVVCTGVLSRQAMRAHFASIDVVVCPSREDPLPIVVTEGLMHRKVVITSTGTGQRDIVEDGVDGFLVPEGDVGALAEKMRYVYEHFDAMGPLRDRARHTYQSHFSMEAFGQRLVQAVEAAEKKFSAAK